MVDSKRTVEQTRAITATREKKRRQNKARASHDAQNKAAPPAPTDESEFDAADCDALARSIAAVVACEPWRAAQLADIEAMHGWHDAARLAVSIAQSASLRLNPWEVAPCDSPPDGPGRRLLERMFAAGVSIYEPDPLAALRQVERPARKAQR